MDRKFYKFNVFVYKYLKEAHSQSEEEGSAVGATGDALVTLNNLISIFLRRLVRQCNNIVTARSPARKILTHRSIELANALVVSNQDLKERLEQAGSDAVAKFEASLVPAKKSKSAKGKNVEMKRKYRHERAGLIFSVSRVESIIMENMVLERKSSKSAVFATALVESLMGKIIDQAVDLVREDKRSRITTKHILRVIRSDGELDALFGGVVLSGGAYYNRYLYHSYQEEVSKREDLDENGEEVGDESEDDE